MNADQHRCMDCILRLYPAHGGPTLASILGELGVLGMPRSRANAAVRGLVELGALQLATAGLGLDGTPETLVTVTQVGERLYDEIEARKTDG